MMFAMIARNSEMNNSLRKGRTEAIHNPYLVPILLVVCGYKLSQDQHIIGRSLQPLLLKGLGTI